MILRTLAFASLFLVAAPAPAQQKKAAPALAPAIAAKVEVRRDLAYVENGHERQKLDIYLPKERSAEPVPLIVWIHGGGWEGGNKDGCPFAMFATQGYVVASINYRLSKHALYPAQLEDCQAALKWLRSKAKEFNVDPAKVGVGGASAGGHLAALVGTAGAKTTDSDGVKVQAVVDIFGPANFLTIWPQSGPDTVIKHNELNSPEGRLFGGPIPEKQELAKQASPTTYVCKECPPFLILHGKQDRLVPWKQSQELHEALEKAGATSELILVDDAGHDGKVAGPNMSKINTFFQKNLGKPAGK